MEDELNANKYFDFAAKDGFFRHGYLLTGNDPSKYKKYTPKEIIEWEIRHKKYRNALNQERASMLIKLAQLYDVDLPANLKLIAKKDNNKSKDPDKPGYSNESK